MSTITGENDSEKLSRLVAAVEKLIKEKRSNFPDDGYVTSRQVMTYLNIKRTKFYEMRKEDRFPKPVYVLGLSDPRWKAQEIREYCEEQL